MSDHLPECVDRICRNPLAEGLTLGEAERMLCCCVELRACEQRIEANNIIIDTINQNNAYDKGYAAGLSAARDAVAALPPIDQRVDDNGLISLVYDKGEALDAIDALREERK